MTAILHPDGRYRCPWPKEDPLYVAYHDEEWGVPERDDRALFEKLLLDGFQAGLSWITILRKRDNFRRAFDGFEPAKIAALRQAQDQCADGRRRHRAQPRQDRRRQSRRRAPISTSWKRARASRRLLWQFVDGEPKVNHRRSIGRCRRRRRVPRDVQGAASRGFKFVGPTIFYAFMQAVGMVNDHLVKCHCHPDSAVK